MKKTVAFFVIVVMFFVFSSIQALAFSGGSGLSTDPYLISTKEELNDVRNDLTACYKLVNDIVFTEDDFIEGGAFYNGGAGFLPIGESDFSQFTGSFEGDNHKIVGLYQNIAPPSPSSTYGGLFGVSSGTIQNLGMEDCNITGLARSAGGIVGLLRGAITNCHFTGNVEGYTNVGGIAGDMIDGTVNNCYNLGDISDGGRYVGGIVGRVCGSFTISNCYNAGHVTSVQQPYELIPSTGGIAGEAYCGRSFDGERGILRNCFNLGTVSSSDNFYTGGICGSIYRYTELQQCYNVASVPGGGIIGYLSDPDRFFTNFTGCYYLDNVSVGVIWGSPDTTTTKLSIQQFQDSNSFVGYDFAADWTMDGNTSYLFPELQSNNIAGKYVAGVTVTGQSDVVRTKSINLNADVTPSDADNKSVTWSVINDTGAATITDSGVLTGTSAGIVKVRATSYLGIYGEKVINVLPLKVTSINVNGQNGAESVYCQSSIQMTANVTPAEADNKTVTWSVENESGTASINASGVLTGLSEGTVLVKAVSNDGSNVIGSKRITVVPIPLYKVEVINGSGSGNYPAGTRITLTANDPQKYLDFDRWIIVSGTAEIENKDSKTTVLTVPSSAVSVKALYRLSEETLRMIISWVDAAVTGNNEITVSFDQVKEATSYEIWRTTGASGDYQKIGTISGLAMKSGQFDTSSGNSGGIVSYCDRNLTVGENYSYKTRAVLDSPSGTMFGDFSQSKSAKATSGVKIPSTPASLKAAVKSYNSVNLSWKKVPKVKGYVIYRAADKNGEYKEMKMVTSGKWTDTTCAPGTTYYYRVRAYTLSGNTKVFSDFSSVAPAAPTLKTPVMTAKKSKLNVAVKWKSIPGAKGYEVWRCGDNGVYALVGTSAKAAFTDKSLGAGTYYYRVRAYRDGVYSAFSADKKVIMK